MSDQTVGPKRVRVVRVLVIEGQEEWVNTTLRQSWVQPNAPRDLAHGSIREAARVREKLED